MQKLLYVNQYYFLMFKNKIKLIHRDIFMYKSIHYCEICKKIKDWNNT